MEVTLKTESEFWANEYWGYVTSVVSSKPTQKNDILKYHIFIEKYHILLMTFIRYHLDIENKYDSNV